MEAHLPLDVSEFFSGFKTFKICTLFILIICFSPEFTFGQKEKKKQWNKITICHKGQTIEINESALQAHLDHGDYIGACGAPVYTGEIISYLPQVGKIEELIGNELTSLVELYKSTGSAASNDVFMISNNSMVLIEIVATEEGKAVVKELLGSEYNIYDLIESEFNPKVITVLFPIDKITDFITELWTDKAKFVQPVYAPIFNGGVVTSLGDMVQYSNIARNAFGVDGQGTTVCVMSDSYNALGLDAASDDVANGDLPGNGIGNPVQVLLDYTNNYGTLSDVKDEGRALMQIIYDIAPGADLIFRTGANGEQDMVNGIFEFNNAGCNIIVDDITYIKEPFFQDGIIAQAVNSVAEEGVLYFTSAGNFANNSYQSQFTPASNNPLNHAFDGNVDIYQDIVFVEGNYKIVLQWDDIYASLDIAGNGAKNDLDIYLLNDLNDTIINSNKNNLEHDPVEVMYFNIEDGSSIAKIVISKASGPDNVAFKYIVFKSFGFDIEKDVPRSSTIAGHANAEGAITVGAVLYSNTPYYDSIPTIAPYSSHGGTSVNGLPLREKPDIIAPDGVNTTVHLDGWDIDNDKIPNFFGTSAAVPHAAGMAALLLSSKPKFGVNFDVRTLMKETAYDMNTTGYDVMSGMGLIQANDAMKTFAAPAPTITKLVFHDSISSGTYPFNVTILGENITTNAQVFMGEDLENELEMVSNNNSQIVAIVPIFDEEDQSILVYNPPHDGTNGTDGGYSESVFLFADPKKKIIVIANDTIKKFGEKLPEFTATILVDSVLIEESGVTLEELGLENLTFSTPATSSSNAGILIIRPDDITETLDATILELYEYSFVPGNLFIEILPITITPNDLTKRYGEKIEGITYRYNFDSTNMDLGEIPGFLESLEQNYKSTFTHEDTIALVNRARFLVNRARFLVNGTSWAATDLLLENRARFLVNGNVVIDIDTTILQDYQEHPSGTISDRARFLVNGEILADGKAYNIDRARFLVNDGALVTNDDSTDVFSEIVVIVDTSDYAISKIYSINLVTGLEVTWDSLHYIVPGAFIAPEAYNFKITYGIGNLEILPAILNVTVDDKHILFEDSLPIFTSTITGYEYEENDSIVFSSITYEPTEYGTAGTYDIIPTFEFRDWINYDFGPLPVNSGTLTVWERINGKIAFVSNRDGNYEIYTMNSDGSNQKKLTNEPAIDADPAWNPTGTRIAYREQSTGTIGIMDIDGNKIRNISSDNPSHPAWSNDGTKIVFDKNGDIYVINSDGTKELQLTSGDNTDGFPDFSPDGLRIVFERDDDIWIMNFDGTITEPFFQDSHYLTHPKYSPDGNQIVFNYGSDIALINIDGSGFVHLYDPITVASDVFPDWSPDGSRLILHVYDGNNDIWAINPDGTGSSQLTTNSASDTNPDWSVAPNDVYIPDPNFEQALIDLGIDSDGIINQRIWRSDAETVTTLDVASMNISDLTGIEAFANLTRLYCQFNQLTNLDLSQNTALIQLYCYNNHIIALDFSSNIALTDLLCYENQLTSLDISQNSALTHLNCYGNQLSSLDVFQNTALIGLSCYDNQLSNLDISQNIDLTVLDCAGNQLTSLDVSPNTALTYLSCPFNQLTSLDVSQNTDLVNLLCAGNRFTSLDLSKSSALTELKCEGNLLTELDVRNGNNTNITNFVANDNNLTCISVDDETVDHSSWSVDPDVIFREDCSNAGYSGARTITGTVTTGDNDELIPGISIIVKGTVSGAVTNIDGEYAIPLLDNDDILVVSLIGYALVEEPIGDRIRVDIVLWPDMSASASSMESSIVQGEITIYPNPVIHVITIIHEDNSVELQDLGVIVYDSYGVIYPLSATIIAVTDGFELDLSELVPGNYILHLTDGKTLEIFRIQKE